ncbi:hypothetical protein [Candidatus Symbiopectobacterium sp. NZEC151]|uniref:hypothetical protein n=1 Tax=Candidatus Symbiopectobacterium sp. NZEC151 TaxID=2820470 RepID=UPI002227D2B5|nr:hypothetical protein [Candidatus Symbiopectobacterium sp. NZEC151]MCW2473500.1 hypothetical protein [Candidatus Symbiopectobacterium sp. NZEC151]
MLDVSSQGNRVCQQYENLAQSSSSSLSTSSTLTRQIVNIDSLPVEMIQKIATYLPTTDYDHLRVTNRTICDALISINSMHTALAEKPLYGAQGAYYKICAEAKHLAARCRRLTECEITTLLNIRVQPDFTINRAISVQFQYPIDDLTLNDGIMEIVEAFCKKLTTMVMHQKPSSCPALRYRYQYNISIEMRTFDAQAEVIFQASNLCTLSQLSDFYACAYQLYNELAIPQRIYLTTMMVKLHRFWRAHPPANLDRQEVDNTIRSYVTLLRSGNDVLAYCKAAKRNSSGEASSNP